MSTFRMLDVAIGMTFVFLLISLICTAISELIEAFLKKRAKDLERGIKELLADPNSSANLGYLKAFYEHPLVYGLFQGGYKAKGGKLPSYIPSRTFALAIMDMVQSSAAGASGAAGTATANAPTPAASTVTVNNNAGAANPAAGINNPAAPAAPNNAITTFRASVFALPAGLNLRRALLTLTDAAGNDISAVRENIENWYNGAMDRVSGWYKRRTQVIILVIGFVSAAGLNADAIAIFKSLSNDSALRESVVAAATGYANATAPTDGSTKETPQSAAALDLALTQLEELKLPIGWDWKDTPTPKGKVSNRELAIPAPTFWPWFRKVLGWLITGVAVSLGAPFWFDVLNKFMVVRSTVKPHEKSLEESSEDRQ